MIFPCFDKWKKQSCPQPLPVKHLPLNTKELLSLTAVKVESAECCEIGSGYLVKPFFPPKELGSTSS